MGTRGEDSIQQQKQLAQFDVENWKPRRRLDFGSFQAKTKRTSELLHEFGAYEARIEETCARPAAEVLWNKNCD